MKETYKAIQVTRPGLLEMVEKDLPEPGPGEVLIKVEACGICGADAGAIEGLERGVEYPRVPGHEVVGTLCKTSDPLPAWLKPGQRVGLAQKPWLEAEDFRGESLITYAVPEDRIDLCRKVLKPAGIPVRRKTTELTMAIVQQVASQRGIAALPIWAVSEYLDKKYVTARSITKNKLMSEIWLASLTDNLDKDFVRDFIHFIRQRCMRLLPDIKIT